MSIVRRFSALRLDQSSVLDANGFLRTKAFATRVGVFKYRGPNGEVVRELRLPEEVFNPDSMSTLNFIPVTNDHPSEGRVTPKNAQQLQVGMTGTATMVEPFVATDVVITREDGILAVQSGKAELSCGYVCDLDWSAGEWQGEPYDAIQRQIRYNHLALVERGRAGSQVRLHLDSGDAEEVDDPTKPTDKPDVVVEPKLETKASPRGDSKPMKVKIGDKEFEIADEKMGAEMCDAISKYTADMFGQKKEAEQKADKAEARADAAEAKLKEKLDAAPVKATAEEIQAAVKARVALEKTASLVELPKEVKVDSLSDVELKKTVIKAHVPQLNLDGKSEGYLDAMFDRVAVEIETSAAGRKKLGESILPTKPARNDGTDEFDAAKARAKFAKDSEEAWKKPFSNSAT